MPKYKAETIPSNPLSSVHPVSRDNGRAAFLKHLEPRHVWSEEAKALFSLPSFLSNNLIILHSVRLVGSKNQPLLNQMSTEDKIKSMANVAEHPRKKLE